MDYEFQRISNMSKCKNLLKNQKITFDNHHPGVEATWDSNLHFHKSVNVKDKDGRVKSVSGSFYVAENKPIGVQWDTGKNRHKKVAGHDKPDLLCDRLKNEICDAMSNPQEAHDFLDNVRDHLKSINSAETNDVKCRRFEEAYNNIMKALGIDERQRVKIKNREENAGLFCLYVDTDRPVNCVEYVTRIVKDYNSKYRTPVSDYVVYFICSHDNKLTLGEFCPAAAYLFRRYGYMISGKGILDSQL